MDVHFRTDFAKLDNRVIEQVSGILIYPLSFRSFDAKPKEEDLARKLP
jgi:hypothetical protein